MPDATVPRPHGGAAAALAALLLFCAIAGAAVPDPVPVNEVPPDPGDTAWMMTATALVLLMTPGLAFFYGGMVRAKNVISTMLQSFVSMGVVSVLWVVVGFSLAFGDSWGGVIGNPLAYPLLQGVGGETHPALAPTIPFALFALFQLKFAIITPGLVTGAFAERVRFTGWLVFVGAFTLLVYCPLAHWTWHPDGFLRQFGVLDFAGGTVVHMSAGFAALAAAITVGRRSDYRLGLVHSPAHVPYVLLGTGMLWFGWFGFNAGSALSASPLAVHAFLTTNTASATAMLTWMLMDGATGRRPSAIGACIGAVVGLVAITPAAGFVTVGASIAIGALSACASHLAVRWRARSSLDDTLDVFACHGVGGLMGMMLTGVFATTAVNPDGADGLLHGGADLFLRHALGLLIVAAFSYGTSYTLFRVVHRMTPLRVTTEQEQVGLDLSQHGESIPA